VQIDRLVVGDPPVQLGDPLSGELPDQLLEVGDPPRGEPLADERAELAVPGRVEHHQGGRKPEGADLVGIEGQTLRGGEAAAVADGVPDVVEPGQRPERRVAVAVHRVVVAQLAVRRIGVELERVREGVVARR
jgi:hypothetical protein